MKMTTEKKDIPWPITYMSSPIHPLREVAMIPKDQAEALFEGAIRTISLIEGWGEICKRTSEDYIAGSEDMAIINLLKKGIGE